MTIYGRILTQLEIAVSPWPHFVRSDAMSNITYAVTEWRCELRSGICDIWFSEVCDSGGGEDRPVRCSWY